MRTIISILCVSLSQTFLPSPMAFADTANDLRKQAEAARLAQMQLESKCAEAKDALALEIGGMNKICTADSDCQVAYIFADSCAAPAVISKKVVLDRHAGLKQRQEKVREACAPLWKDRPPCSPTPAVAACVKGACLDKSSLPPPAPPPLELSARFFDVPLSHGTISTSCAPHDGPALSIRFRSMKLACGTEPANDSPEIRVQLWDAKFVAERKAGSETSVGNGRICQGPSCESLKSFRFKILEVDPGKWLKGKLEGKTYKEFTIPEQTFELIWCESQRNLCG